MRFTFLTILLTLLSLQTVQSQTPTHFNLDVLDDRIGYLKAIYSNDRAVRLYEDSVMVVAGFRSDEHLAAIDSMYRMDSTLTAKINDYLNTYGYPEKESYGDIATLTPLLILNHSANENVRLSHFKTLYKAYKEDNIEERRIIEFLEREYRLRFNKEFRSYSRDKARIKELMQELELKK
jgi:hypothetical protein